MRVPAIRRVLLLGKHLDSIGRIQRSAVEIELLTEEIETHLNAAVPQPLDLSAEQRSEAVAALAKDFQQGRVVPDRRGR